MDSITSIASSALSIYGIKQAVTANNIANMNTHGFETSTVTQQEKTSGGVQASVSKTNDTVDISREAANMILSSNGLKANIKVLQSNDEMSKDMLNIKA